MKEVPLHDAENGLSALVAEVETSGESVIITRHGKPAACLSAIAPKNRGETRRAVAQLLIERLEREASDDGPTWPELKSNMDAERR